MIFLSNRFLREITDGDFRRSKSAILTYLEAHNLYFHEFLHFLNARNLPKYKNQSV